VLTFILWVTGYLGRIIKSTYGFVEDGEQTKFSLLSLVFGFIIGCYWMLRVGKDAIFFDLVGKTYLPTAKLLTPFFLFGILFTFGMIVDKVKKHRLFMIVCVFYALIFSMIGIFLKIGIPQVSHWLINWIPGRILGWVHYLSVETLGGMIVGAVFWAFVSSSTKTESAKRGYPMIFLGAQIGNLVGPSLVTAFSVSFGKANMILFCTGILMLIPILMEIYMKIVPPHLHESDDSGHSKKKKTGAWEGLRLIVTKPFLIGVAVVSTVYEVVGTILDYQFKLIASSVYPVAEELTAFFGFFAMNTAVIGILFAIGGTSFFLQRFGVKYSLLGYPILLGLTVMGLWLYPGLWAFFLAMMLVKSLSYALNNPVKELLYLPTSKDVKMKAKGFIDGFGSKGSKATGALINSSFGGNIEALFSYGSLISLGIIGVWVLIALMVGTKYNQLIEDKQILE
jgi:AAA family ATP:ADP antiporter